MPLSIHEILGPLGPNASLDRLDTWAKCLSLSTRYSGQMPLLIDEILGSNASLDRLILGPNASLDRLDTRAICLSWSSRYSGQMPLLIGLNASRLTKLPWVSTSSTLHYQLKNFTEVWKDLSFLPRLAPPVQVWTQGCMKPKNLSLFVTQKKNRDIQESLVYRFPFFSNLDNCTIFNGFKLKLVTVTVEWDLANSIIQTEEWDQI